MVVIAMEAVIEKQTTPVAVITPKPPMKHRVCPCQIDAEPGFGRCGVKLAGAPSRLSTVGAMDLCVLCQDAVESGIPCRHCGKPATS